MSTNCTKCRAKTPDVQPHGDRAKKMDDTWYDQLVMYVVNKNCRFVSKGSEVEGGSYLESELVR